MQAKTKIDNKEKKIKELTFSSESWTQPTTTLESLLSIVLGYQYLLCIGHPSKFNLS